MLFPSREGKAESVSSAVIPEEAPFVGLVTGERVNCRAGPGLSFEVMIQLSKGEHLFVWKRKGSWYSVQLPVETPVYVSRGLVTILPQEKVAVVKGSSLHVRAGPGISYTSLGRLPRDTVVMVRQVLNEWVEIQPPDFCRGWIHRAYVTFLRERRGDLSNGSTGAVSTD